MNCNPTSYRRTGRGHGSRSAPPKGTICAAEIAPSRARRGAAYFSAAIVWLAPKAPTRAREMLAAHE